MFLTGAHPLMGTGRQEDRNPLRGMSLPMILLLARLALRDLLPARLLAPSRLRVDLRGGDLDLGLLP